MESLDIALVAPCDETTPPEGYGGTERVVSNLAEGLRRHGHNVTLYASRGSHAPGNLVACSDAPIRSLPEAQDPRTRGVLNFEAVALAALHISGQKYDIVHNHTGLQLLTFHKVLNNRHVTTLHRPLSPPWEQQRLEKAGGPYVSVSDTQREDAPDLNYVATIHNGIPIENFPFTHDESVGTKYHGPLVFLGSIVQGQGILDAIKIAKATDRELQIAAKLEPTQKPFYREHVEPDVDNEQIKFLGEVNHAKKVALLTSAAALLMPYHHKTTFGLVGIEAMALGTPAIAANKGGMRETIVDGHTGFLCDNLGEMIERVVDLPMLNPQACRDHVVQNFSADLMTQKYLRVYNQLLE